MKKFCREYSALQKNILFAPGNYHSIKVTMHQKVFKEYLALQNPPKNILFAPEKYHSIQVTAH